MKIRIQKANETITFQEMVPDEEIKEVLKKDLERVNPDFFDLAQRFFECFPQFREVVFNTELTNYDQESY